MRTFFLTPLLCLSLGCGSIGGEGGGGDNLPNRGVVPYERHDGRVLDGSGEVPDTEPEDALVIADGEFRVHSPGALLRAGEVSLYVEVEGEDSTWIASTTSPDGVAFGALESVLEPHGEAGDPPRFGAPAPVELGDELYVAFEVGAGASIGVARWRGDTLEESSTTVLVAPSDATVHEPSLVSVDGVWSLYYEARPADGLSEIRLTTSSDWHTFPAGEPVFAAGEDCVDTAGEAESCWDRGGVGSPEVRVAETAIGRRIYRLWYTGGEVGERDIGFASSFDGREWARFPFNPVISERRWDEWGPTNVFDGERYLLYGAMRKSSGPAGVWAAVNDRPQASEAF